MRSIFTDKVSDTMPLPEYPRPQLVRDGWQNLNGLYDYKISDSSEKKPNDIDGKILVPFAPECFLSKVEKGLKPTERLWDFKKFSLNDNLKGKSILLHFGAVDWECKVYINDTFVGSHIGGYCAFTFDITDFLHEVKMNFPFVYLTRRIRAGSNAANRLTRRMAFGIRLPPVFGRPFGWRRLTAVISESLMLFPILITILYQSI